MGAKARIWLQRIGGGLLVLIGLALVPYLPLPAWVLAVLLAIGLAVGFDQAFRRIPAFDPLGRVRWRLPPDPDGRKRCAVTFDDGPSPSTARVLDILSEAGVTATFFVLSGNAARYPDLVRRAREQGHAVGLHGVDHAKLGGASEGEVERQVVGAMKALGDLGVTPDPIYRTPHGFKSRAVFRICDRLGLTLWAWSRGIWDTDRPDPPVLVRRATRWARSGMVLLLHDGHDDEAHPDVESMVTALPDILRELKGRGFRFVRLTDG